MMWGGGYFCPEPVWTSAEPSISSKGSEDVSSPGRMRAYTHIQYLYTYTHMHSSIKIFRKAFFLVEHQKCMCIRHMLYLEYFSDQIRSIKLNTILADALLKTKLYC